jgi:D-beta-D-heptose 7-phosphate kinase/D-beta-D-heptose 1-phosphate adenosyltransferase
MKIIARSLLSGFAGRTVLVVGDIMLDRFVYGRTDRMSPEAPVPVLARTHEDCMAGGAGNVARNIAALGGSAHVVAAIGDDAAGAILRQTLLNQPGVSAELVTFGKRRTTEKIRFVSDRYQLLRVDVEDTGPIDDAAIVAAAMQALPRSDIVILSDYAKGLLTDETLKALIAAARAAGKPVIADPKSADVVRYDGVTVLTPNRKEAALASGIAGEGDANSAAAGTAMLQAASGIGAVLVTRGPRGMTLVERGQAPLHVQTSAREVFDVSGAGDTVVAALALALAAGCALADAVNVANQAAGLAVAKAGTATVSFAELVTQLEDNSARNYLSKIVTWTQAMEQAAKWRALGRRVGFTNGCFDLIHPGHVSLLAQARASCQHLVVGLNTDASVKRLKGPSRPIQDETARAMVMASMQSVDLVVLFDEDTPLELITALKPDVLVKGADYRADQVVGADIVKSYGGEVVLAILSDGHSTTGTVARVTQR